MNIISRKSKIKSAIEEFVTNYLTYSSAGAPFYTSERLVDVLALNSDTCSVEDASRAINPSWFTNECSCCGENAELLVDMFFEEVTHSGFEVCKSCLAKALCIMDNYSEGK